MTLREIKIKDIFGYSELFSDRETMRLFSGRELTNDLDIKNIVISTREDNNNGDLISWTVTETPMNEFIGFIRLMSYNSHHFEKSYGAIEGLAKWDKFIGSIDRRNGWELDYAILNNYRNKGFMSEALSAILLFCDTNGIKPLYAKVNGAENKATISVLLKNGFSKHSQQLTGEGDSKMLYTWTTPD